MSDFFTIKDAADYLDVEYKTVYRLVTSGKLPAARIGRVYRIPREELEAFLSAQLTAPTLAGEEEEEEDLVCGRCGRNIPSSPDLAGGVCEQRTCEEWLCSPCWRDGHRHCRTHQPTAADQIGQARDALARGEVDRVVTTLQARQREQTFITRIEERIYGIAALQHPLSGEVLQVEDWSKFHSSGDESARLLELKGDAFLERSFLAVTPVNARTLFALTRGALGRNRPRQGLVIEAQCLSDLRTLVEQGHTTSAASLQTLMTHLHVRQQQAEQSNSLYVFALAATSGWQQEAIDYIAASASGQSYRHRLLLPLLVDLHSADLYYNASDERLKGLAGLFRLARESEDALRVQQWIEARIRAEARSGLTLEEVVRQLGASPALVRRTFQQMAAEDRYRFVADEDSGGMLIANT